MYCNNQKSNLVSNKNFDVETCYLQSNVVKSWHAKHTMHIFQWVRSHSNFIHHLIELKTLI